jgi:LmbE family N-acetylglucosaminyl deacetylase
MAARVLVIAPHPDDEVIGCGGALCLHRARGDPVHAVFLSSGERYTEDAPAEPNRRLREAEAEQAGQVLGLQGLDFLRLPDLGLSDDVAGAAGRLWPVLDARRPNIVYLPHPGEAHPDHATALPILRAALAALPPEAELPELRGYEVWSPLPHHDWVEDVSAVMARKLRAVRCYRSQLRVFRYDAAVRGLNRYRGVLGAGSRYGEAFVTLNAPARRPDPPTPL